MKNNHNHNIKDSALRDYYTTGECAEIFHVKPRTIISWIQKGKLKGYTTAGGVHRILKAEVDRLKHDTGQSKVRSKILIIDDEQSVIDTFVSFIESTFTDIEIEYSTDSVEGLMKLGRNIPDLLILDIRMPGLDGFKVIERIKATHIKTKILVVSGHLDESIVSRLQDYNIEGYLPKTLNFFQFAEILKKLLSSLKS